MLSKIMTILTTQKVVQIILLSVVNYVQEDLDVYQPKISFHTAKAYAQSA
jgi:hypothetical protein